MKAFFLRFKNFFSRYERHISSVALVGGFVVDSLTLRRIDFLLENLVLISYLIIAGIGIIFLNKFENKKQASLTSVSLAVPIPAPGKFAEWMHHFFLLAIQFAFGGL